MRHERRTCSGSHRFRFDHGSGAQSGDSFGIWYDRGIVIVRGTKLEGRVDLGVVYLLTRPDHAARLVVSLYSLRRWYDGPVAVFVTRENTGEIAERIASEPRFEPLHLCPLDERSVEDAAKLLPEGLAQANTNYLTKIWAMRESPFETTVFLDADTVVAGDLQPLIESAESFPLTVTNFAGWKTTDAFYQKHFEGWLALAGRSETRFDLRRRLDGLIKDGRQVINTGVMAIQKNAEIFSEWESLAELGSECHIPDEMALQLLLGDYQHNLLGAEYNASPHFAPWIENASIWHMANATHLRDERSRAIWLPLFEECRRGSVAKIEEWSRITAS